MKSLRKLTKRSKVEPKLEIDYNDILGTGGFGIVYKGKFGDRDVAVKQVLARQELSKAQREREEKALNLLAHENVISLFHVKDDGKFRTYVLELCQTSLDRLFLSENHPKKYSGPVPSEREILIQMSRGIQHVHKHLLVHRDIKPENIFIADDSGFVRIKVGDFGLSKPVSVGGSFEMSGVKGTEEYMAPEMLEILAKFQEAEREPTYEKYVELEILLYETHASIKSDVFSTGCVFFYVISKGGHPFGGALVSLNIMKDNPVFLKNFVISNPEHFAVDIIRKMIAHNPDDRMKMEEVTAALEKLDKKAS